MEKTRETITLDSRAQQRLYVLTHVLAGELTTEEASRVLQLSVRQVHRLVDRYRSDGATALVHGNRGRTPANRTDPVVRSRLVELATTEFAGFNPVHLAETLAEEGLIDLAVCPRTIRRILAEAGKALPRTRRSPRHRSRRERMARAGMLLQVDGSRHDWLEGRGPMLTLIGAIDDATGIVTAATFREPGHQAVRLSQPRPDSRPTICARRSGVLGDRFGPDRAESDPLRSPDGADSTNHAVRMRRDVALARSVNGGRRARWSPSAERRGKCRA